MTCRSLLLEVVALITYQWGPSVCHVTKSLFEQIILEVFKIGECFMYICVHGHSYLCFSFQMSQPQKLTSYSVSHGWFISFFWIEVARLFFFLLSSWFRIRMAYIWGCSVLWMLKKVPRDGFMGRGQVRQAKAHDKLICHKVIYHLIVQFFTQLSPLQKSCKCLHV